MLFVLSLLSVLSVAQAAPVGFVAAGVGLPELVHVEGGVWLGPRLDVGLRLSNTVFNWEIGAQVDGVLLGEAIDGPPRHGLVLSGRAQINPRTPMTLASGGDRLGAVITLEPGYGYHGARGLLVRAGVGVLLYLDDGPAAGPNGTLSMGWSF